MLRMHLFNAAAALLKPPKRLLVELPLSRSE
jgi:hypothetical protein